MATPSTSPIDSSPEQEAAHQARKPFVFWLSVYGGIFLAIEVAILLLFVVFGGEKNQQNALLGEAAELRKNQEYDKALAVLVIFGEKWPGAYDTQNFNRRIGEYYLDAGEPKKAAQHLSKSIQLNPNIPGGWSQLGIAYWNQGQKENAVEQFNLELKNGNRDSNLAHYYLGKFYFEQGTFKEAFEHFAAVREDFPQYSELEAYRQEFIQKTLQSNPSEEGTPKANPS